MPAIIYQHKNILKLENILATLVYGIVNGFLQILQYCLRDLRSHLDIKTILLFRTGHLGDTVCAIPAFRALRRYFASAQIILFTDSHSILSNPQSLSSLIGNDIFDEIISYSSEDLGSLKRLFSLSKGLRDRKVDLLLYFGQYDVGVFRLARDMLFFYFSGCKRMYGFRLYKHRIFRIAQRVNREFDCETKRLLKTLRPLGIYQDKPDFNLPISPRDRQVIDSLLPQTLDFKSRLKVAISPGAKFAVNRWPQERFVYLAKALIDGLNAFVVLIGGEDALEVCSFIEHNLKERDRLSNLCGKTTFMQSAEVISRSDFLISSDTGPLHLAEAVGVKVVGIFSARDYPNCWYPWDTQSIILRHELDCQVCLKTECETKECIDGITVEEVLSTCKKICKIDENSGN